MKIDHIVVLKETREGEGRVALTPFVVAQLTTKGYRIMVESEAGALAGFRDEEYAQAGATIFNLNDGLPANSLMMRVKRPIKERELLENELFTPGSVMMGFLDPFDVGSEYHISRWQSRGVTPVSLELLHLTAEHPGNAQAAMSAFAGRLALRDALRHYQGELAKKVTIIGTGPAGLSAALKAKELGLPVQLFGRQEHPRKALEEQGIVYYVLPTSDQALFISEHLDNQTIIITAARSVGIESPLLIDALCLSRLPEKAVLVDLASGEGGNVLGSREDSVVAAERGILIINVSGYPKLEPKEASEAFAQCMMNLLLASLSGDGELDLGKLPGYVLPDKTP